jgi:hypothetical protein
MKVRFFNIDWDTSDNSDELAATDAPELPEEVILDVPEGTDLENEGADILSDQYGFCVNSFNFDEVTPTNKSQAVLRAILHYISTGDVALFDDHQIPTQGDLSFLVALRDGSTVRVSVEPQAVLGNPELHYCPCGRAIEKGHDRCEECIAKFLNTTRPAIDFQAPVFEE